MGKETLTKEERILRELRTVSRMMDTAIAIPGTKLRFGMDSLMGLLPVGGDIASMMISLYLLNRARQLGASNGVLAKMLGNIVLDAAVGSVPVLGDVFDLMFKANNRNLIMLLKEYPELERSIKQVSEANEDDKEES